MALYMDIHKNVKGATEKDLANAHMKDVQVQDQYGVKYLKYWLDEGSGTAFCLVEAPNPEAARRVHHEAHGLVADEIHPVVEGA